MGQEGRGEGWFDFRVDRYRIRADAWWNPQDTEKLPASSIDSDTSLPLAPEPLVDPAPQPTRQQQSDLFSRIPVDPFLNTSQITSELGFGFGGDGGLGAGLGVGLGAQGGGSLLGAQGGLGQESLLSGPGQGQGMQTQGSLLPNTTAPSLLANVDLAFAPVRPPFVPQLQMPVVEPPKWVYMDPQGVVQGAFVEIGVCWG